MNNQEYKDNEKYVTLLHNPKWVKKISDLKELKVEEYENKNFYIIYRKDNQKQERKEQFYTLQYVEETKSFIFDDGKLVLKIIDIIDFEINDKPDLSKWVFTPQ